MTPNPHTPPGGGGCLGKIPENVKTFRKKAKSAAGKIFEISDIIFGFLLLEKHV